MFQVVKTPKGLSNGILKVFTITQILTACLPRAHAEDPSLPSPPPFKQLRYDESYSYLRDSSKQSDLFAAHQLLAGLEAARNRYAGFFGLGCDCFAF